MRNATVCNAIAARYTTRWLRGYARWKLRLDPAFEAVHHELRDTTQPLLDLGCGIGLLTQFLRARGMQIPITGIDSDEEKIQRAREAAASLRGVEFLVGGIQTAPERSGHIVLLDVLQYLPEQQQKRLLEQLRDSLGANSMLLLRTAIDDASWRWQITRCAELFAHKLNWMRPAFIRFPHRQELLDIFSGAEWKCQERSLHGATPFNSYFFVMKRHTP